MSRPVELADVQRRITEYGERASLITVTTENRPHVVSVLVALQGECLGVRVGARTRTNLVARPHLTLTWQPKSDGEYMLILDGIAEVVGEPGTDGVAPITIRVGGGILHGLVRPNSTDAGCVTL